MYKCSACLICDYCDTKQGDYPHLADKEAGMERLAHVTRLNLGMIVVTYWMQQFWITRLQSDLAGGGNEGGEASIVHNKNHHRVMTVPRNPWALPQPPAELLPYKASDPQCQNSCCSRSRCLNAPKHTQVLSCAASGDKGTYL